MWVLKYGPRSAIPCREDYNIDSDNVTDDREDPCLMPWSAYAETCLPTSSFPPLWADNQFHILEMQTGRQKEGSETQQ